ncbi:MAG: Uncharacterized protein K0S02_1645 [Achromobacter mucicolens]|jgi:hypothetical protein|uniref:hypothetical protein n=1 Tax=Achromobacter mucicolens TaxID=1389922 RepID=UPI0024308706|nr:hypothetical protein [Achromobacter mucicolens]MDF2861373.1 Uncharacterized protein [Achromobacter mucicolens]
MADLPPHSPLEYARPDGPVQLGPNDSTLALDRMVAEVVFGIPAESLNTWPFQLPRFSTDRHAASLVLTRVHTLPGGPTRLQQALADELDQWLPPGDRSHFAVLTVLTAAAMCRAALKAARECAAPRSESIGRFTGGLAVDRRQLPVIPCPQSDSENFVINQKLTQYPAWRLWPVHVVAKLFGVLVKVDAMPFGSRRMFRKNQAASSGPGETPSASSESSSL